MSHPSNTALYERMGELMPYITPAELQRLTNCLESNDLDAAHELLLVLEANTRQRKWALRHPAKAKAIQDRYEASEARKEAKRLWHVNKKGPVKPNRKDKN